jgi:hypothetical protein
MRCWSLGTRDAAGWGCWGTEGHLKFIAELTGIVGTFKDLIDQIKFCETIFAIVGRRNFELSVVRSPQKLAHEKAKMWILSATSPTFV